MTLYTRSHRVRFAFAAAALALALGPRLAHAQIDEHPVHWSVRGAPVTIRAGDTARVSLHATIGALFHLYSTTQGPGGPIPTSITVVGSNKYSLIGRVRSPAPDTIPDANFGILTEVYDDSVTLGITLRADPSLAPGASEAMAGVRYQACTSRFCLPPRVDTLRIALVVNGRANEVVALTPAIADSAPARNAPTDSVIAVGATPVARLGTTSGAFAFLVLAASMGALALLTPCVFPMIPITVTSFLSAGTDAGRGRGVSRAGLYALGIIGSFTGLGVLTAAVFGASGLARFSANPLVNLGIAALFVMFALSLIGVVPITLPRMVIERFTSGTSDAAGPFVMGIVFTLTAFTCTAPFVGTLLVMAAQGNWMWPLTGMLVFSTVFAAPFFLLALAPGALRRRPRAGDWMPAIEMTLGALEIAAAIKFISNADLVLGWGVFTRRAVLVLWMMILFVLALALLRPVVARKIDGVRRVGWARSAIAVAALVIAATLVPGLFGRRLGELDAFLPPLSTPRGGTDELSWILNDYSGALAAARSAGKPILADFTGYTCTNCRWMEANMFPRADVKRELERFVRMRLYTDGLGEPYTSQQALEQREFGTVALPLYAVLDANGRPLATFLGMTRDAGSFIGFLTQGATGTR